MYRGAQTTTLLGREGERGKIKADHVNCPKNFVLHCSLEYSNHVEEANHKPRFNIKQGICWPGV